LLHLRLKSLRHLFRIEIWFNSISQRVAVAAILSQRLPRDVCCETLFTPPLSEDFASSARIAHNCFSIGRSIRRVLDFSSDAK